MANPKYIYTEQLTKFYNTQEYSGHRATVYISDMFRFVFIKDGLTKKIKLFNFGEEEFDFTERSFNTFIKEIVIKWKGVQGNARETLIVEKLRLYRTLGGTFLKCSDSDNEGITIYREDMIKFLRLKNILRRTSQLKLTKR